MVWNSIFDSTVVVVLFYACIVLCIMYMTIQPTRLPINWFVSLYHLLLCLRRDIADTHIHWSQTISWVCSCSGWSDLTPLYPTLLGATVTEYSSHASLWACGEGFVLESPRFLRSTPRHRVDFISKTHYWHNLPTHRSPIIMCVIDIIWPLQWITTLFSL